jgi:hypothetical protein
MTQLKPTLRAAAIATAALFAILSAPGALLAQVAPEGPDRVTIEGNAILPPGEFDLPDPATGLAALASYRATLVLSFAGTMSGQPYQWTETHQLEVAAPALRRLTVTTEGLPDMPARLVALTIGTTLWERVDDGVCIAMAAAEAPAETIEPAALLPAFVGAETAGPGTVEGIAALRYIFDERALGDAGLTRTAGEIWVAAEGGHLLSYRLTTTAGEDYFGPGIEGTANIEYDLTRIGEPVAAIELPAYCPPGLVELPLPDGVTPSVNLPGLLAYATAMPVPDAVAFHREQLAALGWAEQLVLFEDEATTVLEFTEGRRRLVLRVAAGATETTVELALAWLP